MLLLVLTALVLGAVGSLAAVASTTSTADACSIAGPWAEASPSRNLQPGQQMQIVGSGFSDLIWHDDRPVPAPEDPPIALCDFDLIPMQGINIIWHGDTTELLAVVGGPDFKVDVTVPVGAMPGKAWIDVGGYELWVSVLDDPTIPPDPCPLMAQPAGSAQHRCPEPWPCPLYLADGAVATQPAPDIGVAPGFLPPCPEPCVDYLHTTAEGTAYDYKWDCPDPCGSPQAAPGASADASAIWCPPPDPCYWVGGDAQVCPDPCVEPFDAEAAQFAPCPDPCWPTPAADPSVGGLCPDPCWPTPAADPSVGGLCPDPCWPTPAADPSVGGLCPDPCWPTPAADPNDPTVCPDPCPIYAHQDAATEPAIAPYCPDPCAPSPAGADSVWCPVPLPAASTTVTVGNVETENVATENVESGAIETSIPEPKPEFQVAVVDQVSSEVPAVDDDPGFMVEVPADAIRQRATSVPRFATPKSPWMHSPLSTAVSQMVSPSAAAVFAGLFG